MSVLQQNSALPWVFLALILAAIGGCVSASEWTCRQSSECADGEFCRVGQCVPAIGFEPVPSAPAGDVGDAWSQLADAGALVVERCPEGTPPTPGELVINEVLANVPIGDEGDANADGTRDAFEDEFVELVNTTDHTLDLTGVALRVGERDKFRFSTTCLESRTAAVIYGGGHPAPSAEYLVRSANSKLSLSNTGGAISIVDADGAVLAGMAYSDSKPVSLTLSPELTGEQYVPHTDLNSGGIFSPGRCANGQSFREGCDDDSTDTAESPDGATAPDEPPQGDENHQNGD